MGEGREDPEEQLWFEGQWEELIPVFRSRLAEARRKGNPREEAHALGTLAFLLIETGDWDEAVRAARADWRLQRGLGQPAEAAASLDQLAQALAKARRNGSALRCRRLALAAFRSLGDAEGACRQGAALGTLLLDLGRWGEALAILEESLERALEHGLDQEACLIHHLVARTQQALRNLPAALHSQHESVRIRMQRGAHGGEGLTWLAELYLEAGRAWEAGECLRAAAGEYRQRDGAEPESLRARYLEIPRGRREARQRLTGPGLRLPGGRRPC